MGTLLEKALATPSGRPARRRSDGAIFKERVELAIALLTGRVTASQAAAATGLTPNSVTASAGSWLRSGVVRGIVKVSMVEDQ